MMILLFYAGILFFTRAIATAFTRAVAIARHFMVFVLPTFIANQPQFYTTPLLMLHFYDPPAATTAQFHHHGNMKYEMIIIND